MAQIEEAESLVKAVLAEGSKEVSEDAFYSRDGDCVFYYAEGGPHDAIRLDGLFTVYVTEKNKRFAGFQVKGVKAFITEVAKAVSAAKNGVELWRLVNDALGRASADPKKFTPIVDRDLRAMYYSDAMKFSGDKKVLIREAA